MLNMINEAIDTQYLPGVWMLYVKLFALRSRLLIEGLYILNKCITVYYDNPLSNKRQKLIKGYQLNSGYNVIIDYLKIDIHIKIIRARGRDQQIQIITH